MCFITVPDPYCGCEPHYSRMHPVSNKLSYLRWLDPVSPEQFNSYIDFNSYTA